MIKRFKELAIILVILIVSWLYPIFFRAIELAVRSNSVNTTGLSWYDDGNWLFEPYINLRVRLSDETRYEVVADGAGGLWLERVTPFGNWDRVMKVDVINLKDFKRTSLRSRIR